MTHTVGVSFSGRISVLPAYITDVSANFSDSLASIAVASLHLAFQMSRLARVVIFQSVQTGESSTEMPANTAAI